MPSSPCGSPLPLHFPPHAMEEQRAPRADGRTRTMPRCFTLRSLCKEPSRRQSPRDPRLRWDGDSGRFHMNTGPGLGPISPK